MNSTFNPKQRGVTSLNLLAVLPFLGLLPAVAFVNRVEPLVLGMPFVLAWIVGWEILSAIIMGVIYCFDPANRAPPSSPPPPRTSGAEDQP